MISQWHHLVIGVHRLEFVRVYLPDTCKIKCLFNSMGSHGEKTSLFMLLHCMSHCKWMALWFWQPYLYILVLYNCLWFPYWWEKIILECQYI